MPSPADIELLLRSYPRARPPLPDEHKACYLQEYLKNREGRRVTTCASRFLEGWMHTQVCKVQKGVDLLELGAGTLNHVPFEPGSVNYDAVEPLREFFENSPHRGRIRALYGSIEDVPSNARYDRIISIAVLEHLTELPYITATCALMLKQGGILQAGIPTEGGLLWGLGWRTTGLEYRLRTGLPYRALMKHEHVNTAAEIVEVLRHFFASVLTRRFPLPLFHASLYTYLEATAPRLERCQEFLASYSHADRPTFQLSSTEPSG